MTTISPTISANGNDFNHSGGTISNPWSSTVLLIGNSGGSWDGLLHFTGVSVPQGTTITSALLKIGGAAGVGGVGSPAVIIHAEDADNPTLPSGGGDLTGRTLTSGVAFTPSLTSGTYSFDITSAVQTVINRAGFAGDKMNIMFKNNGSASNNFLLVFQHENGSGYGVLEITYSAGGGGTSKNLTLMGVG